MALITESPGPAPPGMTPADTSIVSGGHGSARLTPQVWCISRCSWWGVCRAQHMTAGESSLSLDLFLVTVIDGVADSCHSRALVPVLYCASLFTETTSFHSHATP